MPKPPADHVADVVIVGAGSAGCLLAERLSRDPERRVALLEAGGRSCWLGAVPAAFPALFGGRTDWAFETEPQAGLGGRRDRWPRGRGLGGSSAINAMIYARGHPADYDAWAAAGAVGWSARELWPRFRELEDHPLGPSERHGRGGPLRVEALRDPNPLSAAFVEAGVALGWPRDPDAGSSGDGPDHGLGFGPLHVTQRRGARFSAYRAFVAHARRRANLAVVPGARVRRVVLEGDRASGLEVVRGGRPERWSAAEVVLCAGAVQSPQVLLLSGIGAAGELERVGVRPRHDLPGVGRNLWDHLVVPWASEVRGAPTLDGAATPWNFARWLAARRGPLTSNVAEAAGFVRSDGRRTGPPDLQLHFGPAYFVRHGELRSAAPHLTIGPTLLTPASRGRIALRSADPDAPPSIDPGALEAPEDLTRLLDGLAICRELAAQRPLARWLGAEVLPGSQQTSRAALERHVRDWAQTLYHPAGSCRMGAIDDPDAVLGPDLRVRGLAGLRVIDASAMPSPVRGNTQAPVMALALHAAERMLAESL